MSAAATFLQIFTCAAAAASASYMILERRESRLFAAAKAEDLYTLLDTFDQGLTAWFTEACAALAEGGVTGRGGAAWMRAMSDQARARMLINFYFPALWPQAKRVDAAIAVALAALRGGACEDTALALEQALVDLRESMDTLKHDVVSTHRERGHKRLRQASQILRMAA